MTTTRGRGEVGTRPSPRAASRPTWRVPITSPRRIRMSPFSTSSPANRMCWLGSGARPMSTSRPCSSVHSTGTTAVQPSGIGAPVMMRTAVPGVSVKIVVWPAAISPTTGRWTGRSSLASATSRNATAYPSMPELSKTGSETGARTSSATGRPIASIRGCSNGCIGSMRWRTRSR